MISIRVSPEFRLNRGLSVGIAIFRITFAPVASS
jgi:hypothetical protein